MSNATETNQIKIRKLEAEKSKLDMTNSIDRELARYLQDEIEQELALDCENYGLHFKSITPRGGYDRCSYCGSK